MTVLALRWYLMLRYQVSVSAARTRGTAPYWSVQVAARTPETTRVMTASLQTVGTRTAYHLAAAMARQVRDRVDGFRPDSLDGQEMLDQWVARVRFAHGDRVNVTAGWEGARVPPPDPIDDDTIRNGPLVIVAASYALAAAEARRCGLGPGGTGRWFHAATPEQARDRTVGRPPGRYIAVYAPGDFIEQAATRWSDTLDVLRTAGFTAYRAAP